VIDSYSNFFKKKFPYLVLRITQACVRADVVSVYSEAQKGVKSICEDNPFLNIAGVPLKKGYVRIPMPGQSVWSSGMILKFTNALQLEQKFVKCTDCMFLFLCLSILTDLALPRLNASFQWQLPNSPATTQDDSSLIESPCIWNDYLQINEYFPTISSVKEEFFRKLSIVLPFDEQPEIQSCDGANIDVLWDNLAVTLTASNAFSASSKGSFEFFDDCLREECLQFILDHRK
jgi:hypothetical protein